MKLENGPSFIFLSFSLTNLLLFLTIIQNSARQMSVAAAFSIRIAMMEKYFIA